MNYALPSNETTIETTVAALTERGIHVEIVDTKADALERVKALIPAGVTVMTGSSLSLREIGFEDYLISKTHPWVNLKDEIMAEPDPAKQMQLRKQFTVVDYHLGSVNAVTETGELVVASGTGSQIGAYAFSASNLIWVVGAQKITPTLEDAMRRVKEYVMPHEDERLRARTGGKMGTMLGKILIFERESPRMGRTVTLILVREPTGD